MTAIRVWSETSGWVDLVRAGPQGPAGATGPAGPAGPEGPPVSEVYVGPDPPTPRDQRIVWVDTDAVAQPTGPPIVASLPGTPYDGQEVYYQSAAMAANGVAWHLRYRAAAGGAFKWEFVGGGSWTFTGTDAAAGVPVSGGTPTHWTGQPTMTMPLAGDYRLDCRMSAYTTVAPGGTPEFQAYVGNSANPAHYRIFGFGNPTNALYWNLSFAGRVLIPGWAAGENCRIFMAGNGGTWAPRIVELHVQPMRVDNGRRDTNERTFDLRVNTNASGASPFRPRPDACPRPST